VLEWRLDHSDKLEKYREYEERTGCVPDDVKAAPRLDTVCIPLAGEDMIITDPDQLAAWDMFNGLMDSRQIGFSGPGYIPLSEKREWLDENGITDPDDRAELLEMIAEMDSAYRKYLDAKNPKRNKE